jgi:hypothetical protein
MWLITRAVINKFMAVWLAALRAIVVIHAVAWALWPLLNRVPKGLRIGIASAVAIALPFSGLTIASDGKIARVLVAIVGVILAARLYSYWSSDGRRGGFADYARFLSFALVSPYFVYSPAGYAIHRRISPPRELLRLVVAGAAVGITALGACALLSTEVATSSWLVNYLIVIVAFSVIMQALGQACWAGWQLLGIRSKPIVDNIWLSRTPADFWRRWSWPVHAWLNRYVYLPWGGRPRAGRAVMAAFLVSGLAHEVIAGVGLGRVTGHQAAFFLVSGLGVLASGPLEKLARWGVAGETLMRLATIVFMLTSATLMFTTFNYFVPLLGQNSWLEW